VIWNSSKDTSANLNFINLYYNLFKEPEYKPAFFRSLIPGTEHLLMSQTVWNQTGNLKHKCLA